MVKKPSTSIDPANFDIELGKQASYNNTFSQLWELEAYRALIEKDMLTKATNSVEIDIQQYEIERREILEVYGPNFLTGKAQDVIFHHPKDPKMGFKARFFRTDNENYDKIHNSKSHKAVEEYLLSFMGEEDLNSELVIHISKICWAALSAVVYTRSPWHEAEETDRAQMCNTVKQFLLKPNDYQPNNNLDKLFWAIVGQFR